MTLNVVGVQLTVKASEGPYGQGPPGTVLQRCDAAQIDAIQLRDPTTRSRQHGGAREGGHGHVIHVGDTHDDVRGLAE